MSRATLIAVVGCALLTGSCTSSPTGPRLSPEAAKVLALPAAPFVMMYDHHASTQTVRTRVTTPSGEQFELETEIPDKRMVPR